jgi:hypothetical protein
MASSYVEVTVQRGALKPPFTRTESQIKVFIDEKFSLYRSHIAYKPAFYKN